MTLSTIPLSSNQSEKVFGDPYLKVQLGAQTIALFTMQHVQEALVLPVQRLTPMPNRPGCLLGLANRRSRVMWVIDLGRMLGLTPLQAMVQQHSVVIVQVGPMPLGLAVQHVHGLSWVQAETIQPPPGQLATSLVPYLQGCVLQHREVALVLDTEAIVQSPILRHNP